MLPWRSQIEIVRALLDSVEVCRELHGVLRADHFGNPALGLVAEVAIRLGTAQGAPATEGQVQAQLETSPLRDSALGALAEALAAQSPPAPWAIEEGRRVAASAELARLAALVPAYTERADFDGFLEETRKVAALASGGGDSVTGLGEVEARHSPDLVVGLSTGVRKLDSCLRGGGWLPGQLILILGPDGGGKSHAAISFGTAALLAGLRVHDTTLEMDEGERHARYDRAITGIGSNEFWVRLPEVKAELDRVEKRLTILEAVDRPLTVSGLEAEILRLSEKPDLLIVDSGYLLASGMERGATESAIMRHDLASTHQRLRIMGQRVGAPVITPFQANREGFKMMQNSRGGSGSDHITRGEMADALEVSRHADIVISVNQGPHEYSRGHGRLWVDKARGGRQFQEIPCLFSWDRSRIRDREE